MELVKVRLEEKWRFIPVLRDQKDRVGVLVLGS